MMVMKLHVLSLCFLYKCAHMKEDVVVTCMERRKQEDMERAPRRRYVFATEMIVWFWVCMEL